MMASLCLNHRDGSERAASLTEGVGWDYLQYVRGLTRLGHSVYFAEDSGQTKQCITHQTLSRGVRMMKSLVVGQFTCELRRTSARVMQ
jgi:hypothetical protein